MHIALLCLLAIAVGNVLSLLLPKRTVSPELLHLASDFKLPTEDQKPSDHCITCLGGCLDRAGLHNWVSGVTVVPQSALTSFKLSAGLTVASSLATRTKLTVKAGVA